MKRTLLTSLLALSCGREASPKMRELERTHLFSDKELVVHRVLDVDLGVACYVYGGSISCLQISKIPGEEE